MALQLSCQRHLNTTKTSGQSWQEPLLEFQLERMEAKVEQVYFMTYVCTKKPSNNFSRFYSFQSISFFSIIRLCNDNNSGDHEPPLCFFWFGSAFKIMEWRLPPTVERKTVSDFYWLKIPPAPSVAPGARHTVSRLNCSRGPGRQLTQYRDPPILLTPA